MKALSIRQPWAWLICNGFKPVENRDWQPSYRGRFLVHAAKTFDKDGYLWVVANSEQLGVPFGFAKNALPWIYDFTKEPGYLGGIVGEAELYDVTEHPFYPGFQKVPNIKTKPNPWFFGKHGLWLRNAKTLPFQPLRGALGFFDVDQGATP